MRILLLLPCCLFLAISSFAQPWFSEATGGHRKNAAGLNSGNSAVQLSGGDIITFELADTTRLRMTRYNAAGEKLYAYAAPTGLSSLFAVTNAKLLPDGSAALISGLVDSPLLGVFQNAFFVAKVDLTTFQVKLLYQDQGASQFNYKPVFALSDTRIFVLFPGLKFVRVAAYDYALDQVWSRGLCPISHDSTTGGFEAAAMEIINDTLMIVCRDGAAISLALLTTDGNYAGFMEYTPLGLLTNILSIQQLPNGNILLAGGEQFYPLLLEITPAGAPVRIHKYDDPANHLNCFVYVHVHPDGHLTALTDDSNFTFGDFTGVCTLDSSGLPTLTKYLDGTGINYNFHSPVFKDDHILASGISSNGIVFANNVLLDTPEDFSIACHLTDATLTIEPQGLPSVGFFPASYVNLWNSTFLNREEMFTLIPEVTETPLYCNFIASVESVQEFSFALYPVPANQGESVHLEFGQLGPHHISVHSVTGAVLYDGVVTGTEASLSTGGFSPGIYTIRVQEGDGWIASRKMVVRQ